MTDFAAAYKETAERLIAIVEPVRDAEADRIVPATPAWTIKDVVSHLSHVAGSYALGHHSYTTQDVELLASLRGDLPAIDRWAEAGVDERRSRTLADIVDEWRGTTEQLGQMMSGQRTLPAGPSRETLSWAAVSDLAAHAHDIRGALGLSPDRDAYATKLAYVAYTMMLNARAAEVELPALRIVTTRGDVTIGAPDATRTIEMDWFELFRATAGRRSGSQLRQLFDPVDVDPYLATIAPYALPLEPLVI